MHYRSKRLDGDHYGSHVIPIPPGPSVYIVLSAQIDLVNQRRVTEQQGRDLADRLKLPYIETSAKNPPINVDAAFHELVRIVKSYPQEEDQEQV